MSSIEKYNDESFTETAGKSMVKVSAATVPIGLAAAVLPGNFFEWAIGTAILGVVLWIKGQ
jgi:hypothetical protein